MGSRWLGAAIGKRTTVQIECPHIIGALPANLNLTTEDEELGADHSYGMVVTTARSRTVDYNAGPISQYWSAEV
jgi:hypothetical protein